MVARRKREKLYLDVHDIDYSPPLQWQASTYIPGTKWTITEQSTKWPPLRFYCRYSRAVNVKFLPKCDRYSLQLTTPCLSGSGEFEWEVQDRIGEWYCGLLASKIIDAPSFVHIDEFLIEGRYESYSAECDSYCILFEWIGDRFYNIEEWWVDFGASAESWWVIGNEVKVLCNLVTVPFREAKEFFYMLDEWCESICVRLGNILTISEILAKINDTFVMLSYTTSQFVTWLYDSLQESINFEGLWDWINHADDWFDIKLSGFKDGLEDWIAEKFERILDKVFEP